VSQFDIEDFKTEGNWVNIVEVLFTQIRWNILLLLNRVWSDLNTWILLSVTWQTLTRSAEGYIRPPLSFRSIRLFLWKEVGCKLIASRQGWHLKVVCSFLFTNPAIYNIAEFWNSERFVSKLSSSSWSSCWTSSSSNPLSMYWIPEVLVLKTSKEYV